jgi:hypothetical protein
VSGGLRGYSSFEILSLYLYTQAIIHILVLISREIKGNMTCPTKSLNFWSETSSKMPTPEGVNTEVKFLYIIEAWRVAQYRGRKIKETRGH